MKICIGNIITYNKNNFLFTGVVDKIVFRNFLFFKFVKAYEVYSYGTKLMVHKSEIINVSENKGCIT